jgi:hypothetical protein
MSIDMANANSEYWVFPVAVGVGCVFYFAVWKGLPLYWHFWHKRFGKPSPDLEDSATLQSHEPQPVLLTSAEVASRLARPTMMTVGTVLVVLTLIAALFFQGSDFLIAMGWIDVLLLIASAFAGRALKMRVTDKSR